MINEKQKKESFHTNTSINELIHNSLETKYKEEKKMTKKYYLQDEDEGQEGRRTVLVLEEEDITEKLDLSGLVYTTDIDKLEEYSIESVCSDMSISKSENCKFDYIFMLADDLDYQEQQYLIDGWDAVEEDYIKTEEEIKENIIKKMKHNQFEPDNYKVYTYWDGSNWKDIILEGNYNINYSDYTDELEGMEEIDDYKGDTFIDKMYQLKNGEKVLITTSSYQGSLPWLEFLVNKYENIGEYRKDKDILF